MLFLMLDNLIEINRKELCKLAEKKNFNFQDPTVFEKSIYLDKLINMYSNYIALICVNLSWESNTKSSPAQIPA